MVALRNANGRSNLDVLRPLVTAASLARPGLRWLISFPVGMSEAEAAFYAAPFRQLARATGTRRDRWWINRRANLDLRAALARRERFLATPASAPKPDFQWFDSAVVPDQSLFVVVRDDDFTRGILRSSLFRLWWGQGSARVNARLIFDSFPFPWPPATALGALSAAQEDHRHAIARADRHEDADARDAAVFASYGFLPEWRPEKLILELTALGRHRLLPGA
jgi:hypothetical protein